MKRTGILQYFNENDLYFSAINGRGIYVETGEYYKDPLDDAEKELACPVFENIITGERYYAKAVSLNNPGEINKHIANTQNIVSRESLFWPRDVITIREGSTARMNFVEEFYSPMEDYRVSENMKMAVLFGVEDHVDAIPLRMYLNDIRKNNFEDERIRKVAVEIIKAFRELNENGYIYLDICLDKIHIKADGSIFLDYSNLLFREDADNRRMYSKFYPLEFALPALVKKKTRSADRAMQNYSLTALLFYLFIGRDAYDGSLMDDYRNEYDERTHYEKYARYHDVPVFIFDESNRANAIGELGEEEEIIELWDRLPECAKAAFRRTLKEANATSRIHAESTTPDEWLEIFREMRWV